MPEKPAGPKPSRPRLVHAALAGLAAALVVGGVGALVLLAHCDRTAAAEKRLRDLASRVVTDRDADAFIELLDYAGRGEVRELRPAAAQAWLHAVVFVRVRAPGVERVALHFRGTGAPELAAQAGKTLAALRHDPDPRSLEEVFGKLDAPRVAAALEGFVRRREEAIRPGP